MLPRSPKRMRDEGRNIALKEGSGEDGSLGVTVERMREKAS